MAVCTTCNRMPVFGSETICSNCKASAFRGGLKPTPVVAKVGPPTLAPNTLPPGAALRLNCRRQGSHQWQPVNATLYILKDTVIEFQVESQGGAAPLAALVRLDGAQWSGLAIGNGKTCSVKCSNNAANAGVPSTVTASYGGQTASANVVVFSLHITEAFGDNFAGRSTTELGVCENVDLAFTTTPAGLTAVQLGGLRWQFKDNAATNLRQRGGFFTAAGAVNAAVDGTARFRAPFATHPADQMVPSYSDVTIELCLVAGLSQGKGPSKSYRIYKPMAHMTQQGGSAAHHWNPGAPNAELPSAGFTGVFHFTPKNVSFSNIGFREGTGNMQSDGVSAGDEQGIAHAATPVILALGAGNLATGCQVAASDNIHSAAGTYNPTSLLTTNGGTRPVGSLSPTTRVGGKRWPITWEYTYRDISTGTWAATFVEMQKAYHELTVFENGRALMEKGHKGCSECTARVAVDYGVGAAHNWP